MGKRWSLLFAAILLTSTIPVALAETLETKTATEAYTYTDQYIDLSGDWYFKDYRNLGRIVSPLLL